MKLTLGVGDFLTSDTHFGDVGVARRRWCGDDVEKMHRTIAEKWDRDVRETSKVLVLGDVIIGDLEKGFEWFRQRPGRKFLVFGNWDSPHPMNGGHHEAWLESSGGPFEEVADSAEVEIAGYSFLASHFPYWTPKAQSYRLEDQGLPLLHGHTHSPKKVSRAAGLSNSVQLHVGWDAWRRMVPAMALVDELNIEEGA